MLPRMWPDASVTGPEAVQRCRLVGRPSGPRRALRRPRRSRPVSTVEFDTELPAALGARTSSSGCREARPPCQATSRYSWMRPPRRSVLRSRGTPLSSRRRADDDYLDQHRAGPPIRSASLGQGGRRRRRPRGPPRRLGASSRGRQGGLCVTSIIESQQDGIAITHPSMVSKHPSQVAVVGGW